MENNLSEQQNNTQPEIADQQPQQVASENDLLPSEEVCDKSNQTEQAGAADFLPTNVTETAAEKKRLKVVDCVLTVALVVMVLVLLTVILLRSFVISRISVSGESMMPNFSDKQVVWVEKSNVQLRRGDVVVVYKNYVKNTFLAEFSFGSDRQPGGKYEKLIKRVVALEGDKLWVEARGNDHVLVIQTPQGEIIYEDYYTVNGKPAQFYTLEGELTDVPTLGLLGRLSGTTQDNPFVVMEGYFFFLGDNRHNSSDSRQLGALPLNRVYGRVR